MKLRTFFLLLAAAALATFVALNWTAIAAPTTLSLGVTTVMGPLGLILLGLAGILGVALLGYVLYSQRIAMRESVRQAEKLEAQRRLAEEAEASRFTELRAFLAEELQQRNLREDRLRADLFSRLDQVETELRALNPRHEAVAEPLGR